MNLEQDESLIVKVESDNLESPKKKNQLIRGAQTFIAPELLSISQPEDMSGFDHRPSWDVAVRFQDLQRLGNIPEKEKLVLKRRAIEAVYQRARNLMGAVIKPERSLLMNFQEYIAHGSKGDLDVMTTLDSLLLGESELGSLRFNSRKEKNNKIALIVDSSLSMTGEKVALVAVAVAVVALCISSEQYSVMAFDSRIHWLKRFNQTFSIEQLIRAVLEVPIGGFTNLELALEQMHKNVDKFTNVILISDGKYTEGSDPTYLATKFQKLSVLKIGRDQAGRQLLLDLAGRGNGKFFEAKRMQDLPKTIYGAMKTLLR